MSSNAAERLSDSADRADSEIFDLEQHGNFVVAILSAIGVSLSQLDAQLSSAIMRYISGGIGITLDEASWSSAAYLSAQLVSVVLCPQLILKASLRNYLLIVAAAFSLSQVIAGQSQNFATFIAARSITGFCAGAFSTTTLILVLQHVPKKHRLIAFLLFGLPSTLFVPVGYWLGGWLVNQFNWRDIFCVSGVPSAFLLLCFFNFVPSVKIDKADDARFDFKSFFALALAILGAAIITSRASIENCLDSPFICSWLATTCAACIVFVVLQAKSSQKLLNFSILRNVHLLMMIGVNFMFGALLAYTNIIAAFLQNIAGYDSEQVGETAIWAGLVLPFILTLMKRLDHRVLMFLGLLMISLSGFCNSMLNEYLTGADFIVSQIVRAAGQTLVLWPLFNMVISELDEKHHIDVATLYGFSRALGIAVSAAALGVCLTWRDNFHSEHATQSLSMPALRQEQSLLTRQFRLKGRSRSEARSLALIVAKKQLSTETYVRAYSDLFWLMGVLALLATLPLLFVRGNAGQAAVIDTSSIIRLFRRFRVLP